MSDPMPTTAEEQVADAPAPTSARRLEDIRPKMALEGTVIKTELQGAHIDLGLARPGLLHISQLSSKRVLNVTDVVNEGDKLTVYVLAVDTKTGRVDLTLIKPPDVTWEEIRVGNIFTGRVARIEKYGVFIDIGAEKFGMIHVSELSTGYVNDPNQIVNVGDELEAKVINVNARKKQIDLSVRAMEAAQIREETPDEDEDVPSAMELAIRKAMQSNDNGMRFGGKDGKKNRKDDKKRRRASQDEIFSRTLEMHDPKK